MKRGIGFVGVLVAVAVAAAPASAQKVGNPQNGTLGAVINSGHLIAGSTGKLDA